MDNRLPVGFIPSSRAFYDTQLEKNTMEQVMHDTHEEAITKNIKSFGTDRKVQSVGTDRKVHLVCFRCVGERMHQDII